MITELLLVCLGALGQDARPVFLSGAERDAQLEAIEREMGKVKSIVAAFDQVKVLSLFDERVETKGVILFSEPDALRWEIVAPFQSLLVIAGKDAAKFEFVAGEPRPLSLGRGKDLILMVMSDIRDWFRGDFGRTSRTFNIEVSRSPSPALWLEPKNPKQSPNLASIELQLTPDLSAISSVTIRERNADYTTMTFKEVAHKGGLVAELFSVTKPLALRASGLNVPLPR